MVSVTALVVANQPGWDLIIQPAQESITPVTYNRIIRQARKQTQCHWRAGLVIRAEIIVLLFPDSLLVRAHSSFERQFVALRPAASFHNLSLISRTHAADKATTFDLGSSAHVVGYTERRCGRVAVFAGGTIGVSE